MKRSERKGKRKNAKKRSTAVILQKIACEESGIVIKKKRTGKRKQQRTKQGDKEKALLFFCFFLCRVLCSKTGKNGCDSAAGERNT